MAPRAATVTHLFAGWYGVEAGTTLFKVNRQNVDPETLAIIEQVKDYHRIDLADGLTAPVRVEVSFGVKVRAELPTKSAPWLVNDKPWERDGVALRRIIHVDGVYRAWYNASVKEKISVVASAINGRPKLDYGLAFSGLCYMESRDGANWVKPALGLVEFDGSRENNIISTDPNIGGAIFLDEKAPAAECYKSVTNRRYRSYHPGAGKDFPVVGGAISPDGIRWTALPEPVFAWDDDVLGNDHGPEAYRDALTGNYVIYTRANYPRCRSIARIMSREFHTFLPAANLLTPGPQDDPSEDYYGGSNVNYPGAPSSYLMLVSVYHRDTSAIDIRLASSMDGEAWNWRSRARSYHWAAPGAGTAACSLLPVRWSVYPTAGLRLPSMVLRLGTRKVGVCCSSVAKMTATTKRLGPCGKMAGSLASRPRRSEDSPP